MKEEKIEELYNKHTTAYDVCHCNNTCCRCEPVRNMHVYEFTQAIKQAELEWYKKFENNLSRCLSLESITDTHIAIVHYRNKIQEKIKELKNGHS